MKKIFPIITILIFLSLLGIIFFQVLWIRQAEKTKEQQFEEHILIVTATAGNDLVEQKGNLSPFDNKKNNDAFSPLNVFPPTIAHKFSREEVSATIKNAFEKHGFKDIPFEFQIAPTSMIGEVIQSENFFKFYEDSANNKNFIYPLESPSGSVSEGISPEELLVIIVPHIKSIIWKQMSWMVAGAVIFTVIIFCAFFLTIRALLKQKKLSEIKSDFINNMTHEFKTPLATISLAVDALKNEKVINDRTKMDYFSGIIKDENKRMNRQVETILEAALLDKQQIRLNLKAMHAHELIQVALNNIKLPVEEKQGTLEVNLSAPNDLILADDVHFTNLINNLLDNAVKYSKENPVIKLTTQNISHSFRIKIEDNGIGMSKETLHRIFEKFYRAHTGNLHNVKGFGLGLSYVKTLVLSHHGKIKAESTLGKGSCFTIDIPQNKVPNVEG
ncbi:MAG: HAMP domain-containing histidine kinase [Chitinophagaceae bacterium]|nr:HAMP domain-containing histidine kinase [Chitinophagaceae bacterium]